MSDNGENQEPEEPKAEITQEQIEEGLSLIGKVHGKLKGKAPNSKQTARHMRTRNSLLK